MVKLLLEYNLNIEIIGKYSKTNIFEISIFLEDMTIYELLTEYQKKLDF
jgi:hypothetical protein